MSDYESKIRDYYDLKPTRFPALHSLTISQAISPSGVCEQTVSVVLGTDIETTEGRLHVEFYGVRRFALQQPDWSLVTLSHIEILRGREIPNCDGNYLVRDPEQERIIWFECRDFKALIK